MQINTLSTARMRNNEHFQFMTDFRQSVDKFGAGALNIEPQLQNFMILYDQEDEAFKKIRKSAITQEVQDGFRAFLATGAFIFISFRRS